MASAARTTAAAVYDVCSSNGKRTGSARPSSYTRPVQYEPSSRRCGAGPPQQVGGRGAVADGGEGQRALGRLRRRDPRLVADAADAPTLHGERRPSPRPGGPWPPRPSARRSAPGSTSPSPSAPSARTRRVARRRQRHDVGRVAPSRGAARRRRRRAPRRIAGRAGCSTSRSAGRSPTGACRRPRSPTATSPSARRSDSTQSSARSTVGHRWSRKPRSHVQRQWCQTPVAR